MAGRNDWDIPLSAWHWRLNKRFDPIIVLGLLIVRSGNCA